MADRCEDFFRANPVPLTETEKMRMLVGEATCCKEAVLATSQGQSVSVKSHDIVTSIESDSNLRPQSFVMTSTDAERFDVDQCVQYTALLILSNFLPHRYI